MQTATSSIRLLHAARAAVAILFLTACGGEGESVVLGVAGPFSTPYGASMRQGAQLAALEINEAGGIDGRRLELRFHDDQADPDAAVRVAEALLADEEVVGVVGHVNSATMLHAGPVYDRGLPAVATSATSTRISALGDWVFRVAPNDSSTATTLAGAALEMGGGAAILYENEDYGRGLASAFRSALEARGGTVLSSDPYLPTTADLRPFLERMREDGARVVLLAGLTEDAARIVEQATEVGLTATFLGGDGIEGLVEHGQAYDGVRVGVLFHPDTGPDAAAFATRFRAAHGREPDSYAALAYDATRLLAAAARAGGPSRGAIREYLAGVGRNGRPPFDGVTGPIRFDEDGDPIGKGSPIATITGGRLHLERGAVQR